MTSTFFSDLGPQIQVSLALDSWTSPYQVPFLSITAHYISESWQYREVLVGLESISGAQTGKNQATVVEEVLHQHGIMDQLFAITADNASNHSTLRRALASSLQSYDILWDPESTQISCPAHVF